MVLDSNAVDALLVYPDGVAVLRRAVSEGTVDVLYTHVTIDELAVTPNIDRRKLLLLTLAAVGRLVPTGAAVYGFSRYDYARYGDDPEALEAFRSGDIKHTADALIAITAVREGAAVVTADHRLTRRSQARGLRVMTMPELLVHVTQAVPQASP